MNSAPSPEYQSHLNDLAQELVTPDRYGHPAVKLAAILHLPVPEVARVYHLPLPDQPENPAA